MIYFCGVTIYPNEDIKRIDFRRPKRLTGVYGDTLQKVSRFCYIRCGTYRRKYVSAAMRTSEKETGATPVGLARKRHGSTEAGTFEGHPVPSVQT